MAEYLQALVAGMRYYLEGVDWTTLVTNGWWLLSVGTTHDWHSAPATLQGNVKI